MKKIPHYLIVHLFLFVIASTAAAGGIRPDSFTLSGIVGGYSFDGKQHLETRPVFGIRGGYNFTKYFGVEALFDYVPTEGTQTNVDTNVYRFGGDALLHLLPDSNLVPYLAAGYGGITVDRENQKAFTKGIFDYGPGIKYFLTDDLALRGDFRHLVFNDNETLFNYEYTVGITYQFGGKKPAPAPVAAPVPQPVAQPKTEAAPAPEAPLEPIPAAEPTPETMKYCVSLDIEFDIDKADLRPAETAKIGEIVAFMKDNPSYQVELEGFADPRGIEVVTGSLDHCRKNQRSGDKRNVHGKELHRFDDVLGTQVAGIGFFQQADTRVVAKTEIDLAVAGVHGNDARGAVLQEAIGKSTG